MPAAPAAPDAAPADSGLAAGLRILPPVVVQAPRPSPQDLLDRRPAAATVIEVDDLREGLATTATVLERVPGLRVHDYGGLGGFSTVSIRGSTSSQVGVFLDGVPLARAGLGVTNLSDLPFAGVDRIEVYRGAPPPEFASAGMGGVVHLVSRAASPHGPARYHPSIVAGSGSFGTRRLGMSHEAAGGGFAALFVANAMESDGDFDFHDDNGTPLEPNDDETVRRRNNWNRRQEILLSLAAALPGAATLRVSNQWMRNEYGIPGLSSFQSDRAHAGAAWSATHAALIVPRLWASRLELRARADHEWRRDTFVDRASEIGLGYQDNSDVTRAWGGHAGARLVLPRIPSLALDFDARRERFEPWRGFPVPGRDGPEQQRTSIAAAADARVEPWSRLALHGGMRATREHDDFQGDLRTPYSQRPARAEKRRFTEPRAGARLRLGGPLHARASWGRYHRTPGFLELFGDGGMVAGSSDLAAEHGVQRDFGLQASARRAGIDARLEVTWFRNDVENLITFLPQSQRTFVARNIGAARLRGDEWSWRLADAGAARRWSLDGHCTRLDAIDRGVDLTWYAGKALPGRPELQVFQRAAVRIARFELGWEYEHLGRNYLDRWNRDVVARRDLHALDLRCGWNGAALQLGARNLTDERAADVAGFPLPGRTLFVATSFTR